PAGQLRHNRVGDLHQPAALRGQRRQQGLHARGRVTPVAGAHQRQRRAQPGAQRALVQPRTLDRIGSRKRAAARAGGAPDLLQRAAPVGGVGHRLYRAVKRPPARRAGGQSTK
ncbi:hypothetical protein RZS08_07880, partial [Arthrospira platensis SPKY1]|nr:hypothetical protein [Arthrospira platensis SPKY1]